MNIFFLTSASLGFSHVNFLRSSISNGQIKLMSSKSETNGDWQFKLFFNQNHSDFVDLVSKTLALLGGLYSAIAFVLKTTELLQQERSANGSSPLLFERVT